MDNEFLVFLRSSGLYEKKVISEDNIDQLIALIRGECKLSIYCDECREVRVFTMDPLTMVIGDENDLELGNLADYLENLQKLPRFQEKDADGKLYTKNWLWSNWQSDSFTRVMIFSFKCAMDNNHILDYVVRTSANEMIKIGQYPTIATLSFPELKEYKHVIDDESRREFGTALGLFANGVGIGSYVYLRRIFEKIVFKCAKEAIDDGIISQDDFEKAHMDERIGMLKDILPAIITENRTLYGIISKGIHELSEEACLAYFPVLKECIYLIIAQWEQQRKERETRKRLNASISKISSEIK